MQVKKQYIVISRHQPIILFDGLCKLCDKTVHWILKHDKRECFKFCALQNALESTENGVSFDSVVLVWKEKTYTKDDAVLNILKILGKGFVILYWIGRLIPRYFRRMLYSFVARKRYIWFGKLDACLMPDVKWEGRFLD